MKPARSILLFLCLSAGVYFIVMRVFSLQNIQVVGDNLQVEVDHTRLPKTLLFFPSEKIRAQLLLANPILSDIRFEKRYPHTLVLIPTMRSPVAILSTQERRVFVDDRGIVLADIGAVAGGLPVISASIEGIRIGQNVTDARVQTSLAFLTGIKGVLPIDSITITDDGVIRAHVAQLAILFTQDVVVGDLLTTLQSLLAGFRIKGTLPTQIDLRFNKPVISF